MKADTPKAPRMGWVVDFLKRHKDRYSPGDWPNGDDPEESRVFIQLWVDAFEEIGATEDEADRASRKLARNPPNWRKEHVPAVVNAIEAMRRLRQAESGGSSGDSREAAKVTSKGCKYCSGEGLATVWHPKPDYEKRIPETVAAYCVCPHGRWIKANHAGNKELENVRRCIPDLEDILSRRSGWLLESPLMPGAAPPPQPAFDGDDSEDPSIDPYEATREEINAAF